MHTDLTAIVAAQHIQSRMAEATSARQVREARRRTVPSRSRLRAAWGRLGRPSPADPLPPTVVASLRPR